MLFFNFDRAVMLKKKWKLSIKIALMCTILYLIEEELVI